ncbi:hypothetical protein [Xanthomonas vasicola]|uniref:Uncharacterized protein n=1 Tax=Xanthomonas vasicola pv. vasculorum NCPPB 890 TaxID=1184265 RepID=A0A836P099_XANVA|nr:hypothetical protein [Xanthomonas vasicola]KFA29316.1 hypothetical protein KW5_0107830 [Xanthomonas vasicola pv. vasculorum NCPPB 1326]KFA36497.1 hypothetical protein KWG_0100375 [Xanthomonas vasicola pv. vasculorum NCPPB 1381]MBV6748241.1 hypothetical protein [Xanthomonas vasicola pv. vasculorum NCPPB 890]MBV6893906.1 hypothetical protein [Xanthomonas vasicola pv. vasculorum]MDO6949550.1 hypothetical protein [Xanthomonas vasicola]
MNVKPAELPAIVAELMAKYDTARSRAIQAQGSQFNEAAFHAWFTQQVQGPEALAATAGNLAAALMIARDYMDDHTGQHEDIAAVDAALAQYNEFVGLSQKNKQ